MPTRALGVALAVGTALGLAYAMPFAVSSYGSHVAPRRAWQGANGPRISAAESGDRSGSAPRPSSGRRADRAAPG